MHSQVYRFSPLSRIHAPLTTSSPTATQVPTDVPFQSPVEDSCPTDIVDGRTGVYLVSQFQSPVEDSCPTDSVREAFHLMFREIVSVPCRGFMPH